MRRLSIATPAIRLLFAAGLAAVTVVAPCAAAPRTAAMAIDANTGAVLHNQSGDAKRYPASLTKMMTLYMTFELIELGRLSYSTKIKMTKEAAAATPSKLGLKTGETISVLDAIKALVTKSANDVAIALAQHIGGTERKFASLMTRKARQLGMTKTVFRNASGLPDDKQVTTARDMLTLALRLQDEFPRHYKLFRTRRFTYRGRSYRNHNALLGRYRGTDGIKTGYTRASGFNLVASVRRDGKHVVAAVFGGKTGKVRNRRMRSLLNRALKKASTKVTRKPTRFVRPPKPVRAPPPMAARNQPAARPEDRRQSGENAIALAKVRRVLIDPSQATRAARGRSDAARANTPPAFANADTIGSLLARTAPAGQPPRTTTALPPSTLQAQATALTAPQAAPPAQQTAAITPQGPYEVQIGAYADSADAERHMEAARQRAGSLLAAYPAVAVPVQNGTSQLYRARFRGFDATEAASTCLHLRRLQIDCFVARAH